jgi:2-(1,2-epoxy-1,2-dihydrophenyl)acetyl-CoA isomerase
MSYQRVTFEIADGIGHFELNWPERSNALDDVAAREIQQVAEACTEAGDALRCLLISGAGPRFSVGGDITGFGGVGDKLPERLRGDIIAYHRGLELFAALPAPIIAEVKGAAAGGALGLVYIADLAYAAPGTRFATGFIELGLTGDGAGTWFLPRLVGVRRALEIYLTNRVLDAAEARDLGIITDVVEEAKLPEHCLAMARQMAKRPGAVVKSVRKLIFAGGNTPFEEHLKSEMEAICEAGESEFAQTAIKALAERMRG